jgi:BirA family biotin operon repressor/biotin-[acetyl-CoA-carboxylase] ligase
MQLSQSAEIAGVRLRALDTVGSTNAEALVCARAGERGPLWVTARAQSSGRGRRGRVWTSEPGNLYASLLLVGAAPPGVAPQLSFVSALALYDALSTVTPALRARTALKWPNDLLVGGRKIAGILIEGEFLADQTLAVVAGMGVNCAHHPDGANATNLSVEGAEVSPSKLFTALADAMLSRLRQWEQGGNFAAIRADWLALAMGVGTVIKVRSHDGEIAGVFTTLDASGQLVLQMQDGATRLIAAGDVVMPDAALGVIG